MEAIQWTLVSGVGVGRTTLAEDTVMKEFMQIASKAKARARAKARETVISAAHQEISPGSALPNKKARAKANEVSKENVMTVEK